jgi:predicted aspartyl protease
MLPRCLALLLSCAILPLHGKEPPSITPALAGALRTSGMPAAAESVILPFKSTLFGAFTVEVTIDGKPVELVLDMGAASTLLSPETARKLGLQSEGSSEKATSATGGQASETPGLKMSPCSLLK